MKIISSPSRARWPPSGRELNVSISPFFPIGSVNLPLRTHLDRLQPFFTLRLISSTIVFGNGAHARVFFTRTRNPRRLLFFGFLSHSLLSSSYSYFTVLESASQSRHSHRRHVLRKIRFVRSFTVLRLAIASVTLSCRRQMLSASRWGPVNLDLPANLRFSRRAFPVFPILSLLNLAHYTTGQNATQCNLARTLAPSPLGKIHIDTGHRLAQTQSRGNQKLEEKEEEEGHQVDVGC